MDKEWVWLAGLLEGEGYFGATKEGAGRQHSLRVTLTMCDLDVMEKAHQIVGSPVKIGSTANHPSRPSHWSVCYSIQWTGRDAEAIMQRVLPLLGRRRKGRIEESLALYAGHSYWPTTHCYRGHPYDEANLHWEGHKRRCRQCRREGERRRRKEAGP